MDTHTEEKAILDLHRGNKDFWQKKKKKKVRMTFAGLSGIGQECLVEQAGLVIGVWRTGHD